MTDLRITPPLPAGLGAGTGAAASAAAPVSGESFVASLKDAIARVNEAQSHADGAVQSLLSGQSAGLHETMIALQKADISFQLMLQVRNKIVGAYEEIMRMQL